MKKLSLLIAIFSVFVLASCDKKQEDVFKPEIPSFANIEFSVAEQENVQQYEIELSLDGESYKQIGLVLASDKTEENYNIKINITRFFKEANILKIRVKALDKDGKFLYSKVSALTNDL
jgi:hypothetical protein